MLDEVNAEMMVANTASKPVSSGSARPAGRRKRNHLSREMIVAEAVEMLKEGSLDALTLRGLASRLGVGVMSLYTHFPSRDALINGVADHVFSLFEPPEKRAPWQDYVRAWLWATYRLFERFPIGPRVIYWDGRVCSAWLKTWLPVAALLKEEGLAGLDLSFAMDWFGTSGMSFIQSQIDAPRTRQPSVLAFLTDLGPDEQRLAVELWSTFQDTDSSAILSFGFDQIVSGLETFVRRVQERPALPSS
jgi:AcrR family transcriptional regulator